MTEPFCTNVPFIINIWQGADALEGVASHYKNARLSLTRIFECCIFWERGREATHNHLPRQLHTCYKVVEGSTEKNSVKGRSSRADVFSEKGVYKSSQCTQANTCAGVFLIKLQVFSLQRRDSGTDVSLWMLYTFFKYTSRRLLLKKQWISIKFAPIAIAMNFSCFSLFLRLVYGNLLEISMETFIQVFL